MTPRILLPSGHREVATKTPINQGDGYSILYIGKEPEKYLTSINFQQHEWADSYLNAKRQIVIRVKGGMKLPDLIIIDLMLNEQSLNEFIRFLKRSRWTKYIPTIYNEQALNFNQIREITRLQLVDDIVNISTYGNGLRQKGVFLHKSKVLLSEKACYQNIAKKDFNKMNHALVNFLTRRFVEILIASTILIMLLPMILIIMVFIKAESRGPVIYRSKRAGRGCRIFDFYKFRTMRENAEAEVTNMQPLNIYPGNPDSPLFFKTLNDPRVTRVGMFLRNTSLDELPQLVNVIKGDMSLVGNRPLPLYEAATLTNDQWAERFLAPAGMTGLWQVLKRGRKNMSTEERLKLDINYARNNSFARDCWIVANTPRALFQKDNL